MSTLYRLIVINFTLARYGLDEIILSIHFYRQLRLIGLINPFNWFRNKSQSRAVRLRLCIESLGPIFIKFGQMMATRRDLFGDEITDELEKLLDRVPPFPLQQARAARDWLRKSLGSLSQTSSEYLREEVRLTPTQVEFERFQQQATLLKQDVERAEVRLRHLLQSLSSESDKKS